MAPRRTTKHESQEDGEFFFIRDYAPSPLEGLELARQILEGECPADYHPWMVKVQKGRSGRRASVEVVFKGNRRRT